MSGHHLPFYVARAAALCSWGGLALVALAPGPDRSFTGTLDRFERPAAYFLAGFVTRMSFQYVESRWQVAGFAAANALFELLRPRSAAQPPPLPRWASGTAGAFAGIALAKVMLEGFEI